MASLRRLNRRLLRWNRYAAKVGFDRINRRESGWQRAFDAVADERFRRNPYYGYGPCYCVGCIGQGLCDNDGPVDDDEFFCGDPDCSCGDAPDDDAGHGDDWPPDVVTETSFADRGLL